MSFGLVLFFKHFLLPPFNPILNTTQNISRVVFDITIMKSQDTKAEFLQILLSSLIMFKLIAMAVPVDLDYQVQLRAVEIPYVFVNGPLSQEGVA